MKYGELSRKNMIPSHVKNNMLSSNVKKSPLLWLHNKFPPFAAKSEMVWYFIGLYIIIRTLHGRLEVRNFSSRVKKYFNTRREISYLRAAM